MFHIHQEKFIWVMLNYTIGDVIARYKYTTVLYCIYVDVFGLPAENASKANNLHPMEWTIKHRNNGDH